MVSVSKRESINPRVGCGDRGHGGGKRRRVEEHNHDDEEGADTEGGAKVLDRRMLRSRYLQVKSRITDEKDDMEKADSNKFKSIIEEVDNLHQLVQKPREQVADAEALLDIMNTLVISVRSECNESLTPAEFVSCLLRDFGQQGGSSSSSSSSSSTIQWKGIGLAMSHVFSIAPGCSTMIGPMNTGIKPRKIIARRKHTKVSEKAMPEELEVAVAAEEKTDTDKNMATMFDIMRKNRKARLENLILNRSSFAQTVENLFALSFLLRDGRAEITVDENGRHLVSPRNAPASSAVQSGNVSYGHFVFRLDFSDWKLMLSCVVDGEELMPHRNAVVTPGSSQPDAASPETQRVLPTTPIRKLSRNRGLSMQEPDSLQNEESSAGRADVIRKGKRKLI